MYKRLGILGGMGPLATYTLYKNIIENTHVSCDQEHIDMCILNASYIPDRTNGILYGEKSPLPFLLDGIKRLEIDNNCDLICVPCNTSHYFFNEMQSNCKHADMLNMIELTAEELLKKNVKTVYLFATEGTIKTKVYHKYFNAKSINLIEPKNSEIKEMQRIIYSIKAGNIPDLSELELIAKSYGEFIVFGCTEFSTDVFKSKFKLSNSNYLDAMNVLLENILQLFNVKNMNEKLIEVEK